MATSSVDNTGPVNFLSRSGGKQAQVIESLTQFANFTTAVEREGYLQNICVQYEKKPNSTSLQVLVQFLKKYVDATETIEDDPVDGINSTLRFLLDMCNSSEEKIGNIIHEGPQSLVLRGSGFNLYGNHYDVSKIDHVVDELIAKTLQEQDNAALVEFYPGIGKYKILSERNKWRPTLINGSLFYWANNSNDFFSIIHPCNGIDDSATTFTVRSPIKLRVNLYIDLTLSSDKNEYKKEKYNQIRDFAYLTICFFAQRKYQKQFNILKIPSYFKFMSETDSHVIENNQVTIYLNNVTESAVIKIGRKLDRFIKTNFTIGYSHSNNDLHPKDRNFGLDRRINGSTYVSCRNEERSADNKMHLDVVCENTLRNNHLEIFNFFAEVVKRDNKDTMFSVPQYNPSIKLSELKYDIIDSYNSLNESDRAEFLERFPSLSLLSQESK